MEETLKASEAKYKALFENAQVGMYRLKIDGSALLEVNNKFTEILGFTHKELLGSGGSRSEQRCFILFFTSKRDYKLIVFDNFSHQ